VPTGGWVIFVPLNEVALVVEAEEVDKYSLLIPLELVNDGEEILVILVVVAVEVGTGVLKESEVLGTSGIRGANGTPQVELNTVFWFTIELVEDVPTELELFLTLVGGGPFDQPGGSM